MPEPRNTKVKRFTDDPPEMAGVPLDGFDIVHTIGRVTLSATTPGKSATEVAFGIIGSYLHDAGGPEAEGTFSFPAEWGGMLHVTVETRPS